MHNLCKVLIFLLFWGFSHLRQLLDTSDVIYVTTPYLQCFEVFTICVQGQCLELITGCRPQNLWLVCRSEMPRGQCGSSVTCVGILKEVEFVNMCICETENSVKEVYCEEFSTLHECRAHFQETRTIGIRLFTQSSLLLDVWIVLSRKP